jgi:peptide/nickel transport system permease protein
MLTFIIRRMIATVFVVFTITVLVFLIFFHTPGVDPARKLAGRNPSPETIKAIKHQYGLDRPLPVQYVILMKKLFITRDLTSYSNQGQKVVPEIVAATPVTLSLVLGAAVIWVVVSIIMGVAAAVLRGTIFDPMLMVLALIGISMPVFWLGEMANLITQSRYHDTFLFSWVPPLGYTAFTQDPFMWFKHLVIPWIVLAVLYIGFYGRVLRSDLIESESNDFVRTARAKGLDAGRVMTRHQLRNSMVVFISLFGLDFGALVGGGALLVEVVFGLPGVGRLTYNALTGLDLPVIMATVIYGAFFIVLANAIVDVGYVYLDPRLRPH